ncbi:hypothetical protein EHQ58_10140 [Leptospira ognonensis]|uniref:Uncharacterized protein n=1 Tax=Leptospira ognonensis TaxID=2484945 RepID=A0A4R9K1I5_9LEPT|nr:hypothetical protein [Leptospira ognonensis]TGL58670.1 hypothetical protein EHQ58_10140 [Leptospira ognonensis]
MTGEYGPQSDEDQFVLTGEAEKYLEDSGYHPVCQVCKKHVPLKKLNWDEQKIHESLEFKCHGKGLKFHFFEKKVFKVEELI